MIIYNSYILIWYGLWLYLLLCLCIKVFIDCHKRRHYVRKQHHIHKFFFAHPEYVNKRVAKHILKYSKDDLLFVYICECYFHLKQSEQSKINYETNILMKRIFKQKLRLAPKDDLLLRKLIFKNIYKFEAKDYGNCTAGDSEKTTLEYVEQKELKNAYYS